jgi:hypothetical protein
MSTQDTFMKVVTVGVIVSVVGLAYWHFIGWFCNTMTGRDPLPPANLKIVKKKKNTKKVTKKVSKKTR